MKRNGAFNSTRFAAETVATSPARDMDGDFERPVARTGTLTRTKTLFLAAVRLWELKRGLRE